MRNPGILNLRLRYQSELKNYLVEKKIDFVNIPFADLFNGTGFIKQMEHCMNKFKLPFDKRNVTQAHKKWVYSNVRLDKIKLNKSEIEYWKKQNNTQTDFTRNLNKPKLTKTQETV